MQGLVGYPTSPLSTIILYHTIKKKYTPLTQKIFLFINFSVYCKFISIITAETTYQKSLEYCIIENDSLRK